MAGWEKENVRKNLTIRKTGMVYYEHLATYSTDLVFMVYYQEINNPILEEVK